MLNWLTAILNFAVLSWFFWIMIGAFAGISYWYIRPKNGQKYLAEFKFGPIFFIAMMVAASAYRWPEVREWVMPWKCLITLGAYTVVGVLTMLIKWRTVTSNYYHGAADAFSKFGNESPTNQARFVASHMDLPENAIEYNAKIPEFLLNWKVFPFGTWLVYWPYYIFSIVLEPIMNIANSIVTSMKGVFIQMAHSTAYRPPTPAPAVPATTKN